MSYIAIAEKIPADYRKEILETNMIAAAQCVGHDPSMYYLFTVWKNYVEPDGDLHLECNACLERILKNYRELQPVLAGLEKGSRLMKEL